MVVGGVVVPVMGDMNEREITREEVARALKAIIYLPRSFPPIQGGDPGFDIIFFYTMQ